jgi:hypothetical protein
MALCVNNVNILLIVKIVVDTLVIVVYTKNVSEGCSFKRKPSDEIPSKRWAV